jgi:integrase
MTRSKYKLTAAQVNKTKKAGIYADGAGLYLQVTAGSDGEPRKSWFFRFRAPSGRMRDMGLGSAGVIELARARIKADAARALVTEGIDPIEHRAEEKLRAASEAATVVTFKQAAERFLAAHKHTWANSKHKQQWENTLENYVYPVFGSVAVGNVNVDLVLRVIEPIWKEKTETASRVRSRIERVLDWATARGLREGDNPARWRGRLENVLPSRVPGEHHAALPFKEIPTFMAELNTREGMGALALRFTILTAARTSEVRGATWAEVDLDEKVWHVPATRMKAKRAHRVPLTDDAVQLLQSVKLDREGADFVFPGLKAGKPLSDMTLLAALKQMRPELTVHGFRSAFRDWVAETTDFPGEVAEAALAHIVGDKVEAAYRRGDLFEKRRKLMEAWAEYCASG